MSKPATPGQEGPSFAPPADLPSGWIAQWDGHSKKYYFVQLSTGASQWETPTQAAPTGPTPQATPQGMDHPYGTPSMQGEVVMNPDGTQSVRGVDGDRSLSGNIGQFALNQLLGGKSSNNHSSGSGGGLGALAGQFLGGGKQSQSGSHSNNSAGSGIASSLVGGLVSSFTNSGKKPESNYSGSQPQQSQGGFLGGMFGGSHGAQSQGSNYGYSQQGGSQGGYTGAAPPTSYQPTGTAHTSYNPPPSQQGQHSAYSQNQPPPQSYNSAPPPHNSYGASPNPSQSHGATPNQTNPPYGQPSSQSNPQYGAPPNSHQYGSGPPQGGAPYGGVQHQDSFGGHGSGPPQSHQYNAQPGAYPQAGAYPQQAPPHNQGPPSGYGGPQHPSGNLPQPHHSHFQGLHNAEHSGGLYGNSGPPPPMGTHPNNAQPSYNQPPGGYGGQGRW